MAEELVVVERTEVAAAHIVVVVEHIVEVAVRIVVVDTLVVGADAAVVVGPCFEATGEVVVAFVVGIALVELVHSGRIVVVVGLAVADLDFDVYYLHSVFVGIVVADVVEAQVVVADTAADHDVQRVVVVDDDTEVVDFAEFAVVADSMFVVLVVVHVYHYFHIHRSLHSPNMPAMLHSLHHSVH